MNIEKIKEFIAMRKELKEAGVIAVDMWSDSVHVDKESLADLPNLTVKSDYDKDYPYRVSTIVDGIEMFSIYTEEEFVKYHQLQGFMQDDVDLTGGDDHAA